MTEQEITIKDVHTGVQEIKALLLKMNMRINIKTVIDKVNKIIGLCKEKSELNTHDIVDIFDVSNRVAITYLKKASEIEDRIIYFKGRPSNPSKIIFIEEGNELPLIAKSIIEDMKSSGRGTTKRISAIMNQYRLNEKEIVDLLPLIVKYSGGKIEITQPDRNKLLVDRRLWYKGGL